jgi:hypothetical protein
LQERGRCAYFKFTLSVNANPQVRSTHLEVVALRESLARAQEHSVVQSHRMASHLREFKGQLEAVNDVEVWGSLFERI